MPRIRVNTDDLKSKAKDFDAAAEAFRKAGDEIAAFALSLPSYEGQLSGPARKAGYEIQKNSREISADLSGNAESLRKSAQEFEDVDNQTVGILENNTVSLSAAFVPDCPEGEDGGPLRKGGNPDLLCYYDYGDSVIIYQFGESIILNVTDENREMVEKYIKSVDEFCKNLADMINIFRDMMLQYLSVQQIAMILAIYVGLGMLSIPIAAAIAKALGISVVTTAIATDSVAGLLIDMANLSPWDLCQRLGLLLDPANPQRYIEDLQKLSKVGPATSRAFSDAQEAWSALAPETPPGPSVPIPTPPSQTPMPTETPPTPTETPPPPKRP
jgi:hypothetical protein